MFPSLENSSHCIHNLKTLRLKNENVNREREITWMDSERAFKLVLDPTRYKNFKILTTRVKTRMWLGFSVSLSRIFFLSLFFWYIDSESVFFINELSTSFSEKTHDQILFYSLNSCVLLNFCITLSESFQLI